VHHRDTSNVLIALIRWEQKTYSCANCWYVSALWIYSCRPTVHYLFLSVSLLYYCI